MNTTYNDNFEDSELEIDLKKIYLSLKKGIKWVVITPSIIVAISIIYVLFIAKPIYTSETTLLLVNSGGDQSKLTSLAGQFGFSLPSSQDGNVKYTGKDTGKRGGSKDKIIIGGSIAWCRRILRRHELFAR